MPRLTDEVALKSLVLRAFAVCFDFFAFRKNVHWEEGDILIQLDEQAFHFDFTDATLHSSHFLFLCVSAFPCAASSTHSVVKTSWPSCAKGNLGVTATWSKYLWTTFRPQHLRIGFVTRVPQFLWHHHNLHNWDQPNCSPGQHVLLSKREFQPETLSSTTPDDFKSTASCELLSSLMIQSLYRVLTS